MSLQVFTKFAEKISNNLDADHSITLNILHFDSIGLKEAKKIALVDSNAYVNGYGNIVAYHNDILNRDISRIDLENLTNKYNNLVTGKNQFGIIKINNILDKNRIKDALYEIEDDIKEASNEINRALDKVQYMKSQFINL